MKNKLISVVIPAYNAEKTIEKCLDSVIRQNYPNKEIIVVDDFSTDLTCRIVQSYADIKLVALKHHIGLPGNVRNVGIYTAAGKYISFIDSDDFWDENVLCELIQSANITKEKCLFYGTLDFVGNGSAAKNYHETHKPFTGNVFYKLITKNFIPMHPVLIEKKILDKIGGFDEKLQLKIAEDYDLWLRIAYQYPVKFVPPARGYYNLHPASSMAQLDRIEKNLSVLKVLMKIKILYNIRHRNMFRRLAVVNYTIFSLSSDKGKICLSSLIKVG
ncbi:glycosyltransferase, partial [bacterium]|nr:glycosyltransferase [bacterium]